MSVEKQASYFVGFVGNDRAFKERDQRHVRQSKASGYAFFLGGGSNAGELVAGTERGGFGEQLAEVLEVVNGAAN